jgi:acyl-coenzyme A thioesterase 9
LPWEEAEKGTKLKRKENLRMERLDALLAEGQVFSDMPALADRSILIQDTRPWNSCICQPQQRNIHGCISGGFFMRKAFEQTFSNAYAFSGAAPCIFEVDDVDFLKPASLNALLSNIAVWNRF